MNIEACIAELLRRSTGRTLTLKQLHDALRAEAGAAAGTYHQLQQRLKQASSAFLVLERPNPLQDGVGWPGALRAQYESALSRAGLDSSPIVSLLLPDEEEPTSLLGLLERTIIHLCEQGRSDSAFQPTLLNVLTDLPTIGGALRSAPQPTTARRDPLVAN